MNFSFNWLSELVTEMKVSPVELSRLVTMKTAESEGVHEVAPWLARVSAARILSAERIAGTHNWKATLETGRFGVKTVVCGAPNCRAGLVSAYVPAGTELNGRRIEKTVVAGVESDGMLASGAELGINRDAAGILEIEAEPGAPIPGCAPDSVIEIDNKSITHRPDLWGHHGLAREIAAILRVGLCEPADSRLIPSGAAVVHVAVEDYALCPRYSALVFENVTVRPSPLWMQYRLEAIGLNPINNIVDTTNYVMVELAQPMHAFDRDLLHGNTIFVRRARPGELVVALNEESYRLEPSNLVIADEKGAIAIAGVIGGLDSAIHAGTERIVLESACFSASNIRRTSTSLKLRTDASMRFEKAQDPVNTVRGLARAVALLSEVSPGIRLVGGLADDRREPAAPPPIRLPMDWLTRKLGRAVAPAEVRDILERLSFGVSEPEPRTFLVTVPSWRATKDVSIKDDLVEEVGRMIGYDSITPQPPVMVVTPPPANEERKFHHAVRDMMAAQGFTEVYNYSFLSEEQAAALGFPPEDHLRVQNPISSEQGLMRLSLLPEIYKNILENSRHLDSFRLFEIGREIHKQPEGLPLEIPHLVAAMYSKSDGARGELLLELKRVAQCLMREAEIRPVTAREFEHPARVGEVVWGESAAGRLFELHPNLLAGRAAVLDVNLQVMERLAAARETRYRPLRRFPTSEFDLSVIARERDLAGELQKHLARFAGDRLESIEYLRHYTGPQIPAGYQSVSFRLSVGASDRTLSLEEVGAIRAQIIEEMRKLGYELRV